MTTEVYIAGPEHLGAFDHIADGVFAEPIVAEQLTLFLADPRHLAAVVSERIGGKPVIVAAATGVTCFRPTGKPRLWIDTARVAAGRTDAPALRRAALRGLLDEGRRLGCAEAWLTATWADRAARELCERLGGTEADGGARIVFSLARRSGPHDAFDDR